MRRRPLTYPSEMGASIVPRSARGTAVHDREVPALEGVLGKQLPARAMRLAGERDRPARPRCRDRGDAARRRTPAPVQVPRVFLRAAQHRVFRRLGLGVARNRQQAGRLVDDEDLVVFVEPDRSSRARWQRRRDRIEARWWSDRSDLERWHRARSTPSTVTWPRSIAIADARPRQLGLTVRAAVDRAASLVHGAEGGGTRRLRRLLERIRELDQPRLARTPCR